jgi:hypothetical protein
MRGLGGELLDERGGMLIPTYERYALCRRS